MPSPRPHWVFASHDATLYGATRSLLLLLEALPEPERARLIVPWDGPLVERARAAGIATEIVPRDDEPRLTPVQRLAHLRRVRAVLREWRPDSIVVNTMAHGAPLMAARAIRIPALLHVREHPGYFQPKHALGRARLRAMMTTPRRIVCVSRATRQLVLDAGADPERVDVVYNGVDVDQFAPDPERRRRWRAERGFTDDDVVCGFVGQLILRKGWDLFIEAAGHLADSAPRARFVIVGASPDTPDYAALQEAHAGSTLGARLRVEPFAEDVRAAFDGMDIFVNPTRNEPFARVNLEAMAAAKPIVATDVGGNPEAIDDGDTGRIVAVDPGAIAAALESLIDDAPTRSAMGAAGRERVVMHFAAGRYQREMLARLEALAGA